MITTSEARSMTWSLSEFGQGHVLFGAASGLARRTGPPQMATADVAGRASGAAKAAIVLL